MSKTAEEALTDREKIFMIWALENSMPDIKAGKNPMFDMGDYTNLRRKLYKISNI